MMAYYAAVPPSLPWLYDPIVQPKTVVSAVETCSAEFKLLPLLRFSLSLFLPLFHSHPNVRTALLQHKTQTQIAEVTDGRVLSC